MKPIIFAPNFQLVIPGRRSEAEANPESSNHRPGLLDSGFSTLGLRPTVSPQNDEAYDSNLEIAELGSPGQILVLDRQAADALAIRSEDGVGDRGRNHRCARLPDAAPFLAAGEGEMHLGLRRVFQPNHRVGVEVALLDAAAPDRDFAEQHGAQAVDHAASEL